MLGLSCIIRNISRATFSTKVGSKVNSNCNYIEVHIRVLLWSAWLIHMMLIKLFISRMSRDCNKFYFTRSDSKFMVKYSQFVLHIFILNRYTILSTIPAQDEGDTLGQTESSSLLAEVELLHHQSPYKNYKSNFRHFLQDGNTLQIWTTTNSFSLLPAWVVLRHLNQHVEYEAGQLTLVHHRLTRGQ